MAKKSHKKSTFWKRIKFKYKLSFLNENTLEEVFSLRLSRLNGILIIGLFGFILVALTSFIIINTPIRNYLPGYLDSEVRSEMMSQALNTDSLEQAMASQSLYLNNLGGILRGDKKIDSIRQIDSVKRNIDPNFEIKKSRETEEFMKKYEDEEKYNLTSLSENVKFSGMSFYKPVKGMISSHFDAKQKHFGIDIVSDPKSSILATLEGTVIFAGYDPNAGYFIQLQHSNGFISIYKHNAMLLKRQGDRVKSGEAIAIIGNTGKLSTGEHLHFELWYKGSPVNPEDYIVF